MKRLLFVLCAILVVVAPISALAQGPGEGGPIVEGTSGLDNISSFNPLRCNGTDCQRIYLFLFPSLVGISPGTTDIVPNVPGALAESWEFSEDGTELTVVLRQDMFWTDGEQITAEDVKFTYDAIASAEIESDLSGYIDSIITGVEVVDDFTVKLTYANPDCGALNVAGYLTIIPSHAFESFADMVDNEFDTAPQPSSGVFMYDSTLEGQQINLAANQNYVDAPNGVVPMGYIYLDVPDQSVEVDRFLAGELNVINSPQSARRPEIREAAEAGELQMFDFPANAYTYIGLNLANPDNPQPGADEAGNPVEQEPHPIFGDVRVRQALSHSVDYEGIIENILLGEATRMPSNETPTAWTYNDQLEFPEFDLELAAQMLEEAGWTDEDGDGVRECHGCLYAEEGTPFSFEIITNEDNTARTEIATAWQDSLSQIGVEATPTFLDFNTVIDNLLNQTFDASVMAWSLSYPPDPDNTQLFGRAADAPGAGYNFTSWHNEEYMSLNEQARTLPGCDQAARAELYREMQRIFQEDMTYIVTHQPLDMYAAGPNVSGFEPYANQLFWNVHDWAIQQ